MGGETLLRKYVVGNIPKLKKLFAVVWLIKIFEMLSGNFNVRFHPLQHQHTV